MKKKKLKKRIKRLEDICGQATSHYWDAHKDFEKLKVDFETTKRTVKDDLVEHNVNQIKKYDFMVRAEKE